MQPAAFAAGASKGSLQGCSLGWSSRTAAKGGPTSRAPGTTKAPLTEWIRGHSRSCGSPGACHPGWPLASRSNGEASSASWNWAA
eukprot:2249767-Alexandrium_andersonii.AAC.1